MVASMPSKRMRERDLLGLAEGLVEAGGDKRVSLVDLALERDQMHDGINAGAPIVIGLDFWKIGKQPRDPRIASERFRHIAADHCIDRSVLEQVTERLVARVVFDRNLLEHWGRAGIAVSSG